MPDEAETKTRKPRLSKPRVDGLKLLSDTIDRKFMDGRRTRPQLFFTLSFDPDELNEQLRIIRMALDYIDDLHEWYHQRKTKS